MVKVTLANALKYKNRLAEKLSKVSGLVQTHNSGNEERTVPVDVRKQYELRQQVVAALIEIKNAIYQANQGIQSRIFTNAERKVEITFLGSINTSEGISERTVRWGADEKVVKLNAVIKFDEVQARIADLEAAIDKTQDEIDAYNHATVLDLNDSVLDALKAK